MIEIKVTRFVSIYLFKKLEFDNMHMLGTAVIFFILAGTFQAMGQGIAPGDK